MPRHSETAKILVQLILALALTAAASAESRTGRRSCAPSTEIAHRLQDAETAGAGSSTAARQALERLNSSTGLRPCDRAHVLAALGRFLLVDEHYGPAAAQLEAALEIGLLPPDAAWGAALNLAQAYLFQNQARRAVQLLAPRLASDADPPPLGRFLLGRAWADLEAYSRALPQLEQAAAQLERPPEHWLQLLAFTQYELGLLRAGISTLRLLAGRFKRKRYLLQIAAAFTELQDAHQAAAVLEVAAAAGLLTEEQEYLWLTQLQLAAGQPQRAGSTLQSALDQGFVAARADHLRLLSNAWLQAKEMDLAAAALERAAEQGAGADALLNLGRIYIEQGRWQQAVQALERAAADVPAAGRAQAHYLLGYCRHELGRRGDAESALLRAAQEGSAPAREFLKRLQDSHRSRS